MIDIGIVSRQYCLNFQEMSSGNSWAVYCRESEKDRSKMEVNFNGKVQRKIRF